METYFEEVNVSAPRPKNFNRPFDFRLPSKLFELFESDELDAFSGVFISILFFMKNFQKFSYLNSSA